MIIVRLADHGVHSRNWKLDRGRSDLASPDRGYCFYGLWTRNYGWSINVTRTHSSSWGRLV